MEDSFQRVPISCPQGFRGEYTVVQGDSMYKIAQLFNISLQQLIMVNPQITNPDLIYPGDKLCVPAIIKIPCAVVLNPCLNAPIGTQGSALAYFYKTNNEQICYDLNELNDDLNNLYDCNCVGINDNSEKMLEGILVSAVLPLPSYWGNFDMYTATAYFEGIGGFGNVLSPNDQIPPAYCVKIEISPLAPITPCVYIVVEPYNSETGETGPVVLKGDFMSCCGCYKN